MWRLAVILRFQATQAFLSSDECESVKCALFELWGDAYVNDVFSVKATETSAACSAHLERWEKWKLQGEAINRLTSTASKEVDITLVILGRSVANLRFFARGKRGVLYAGEMRSDNKPLVAKLAADATSVRSVTQEARWLRRMRRMTIGPKVIDAGNGWFLCERLEGENVIEFLGLDDKVATPANERYVDHS